MQRSFSLQCRFWTIVCVRMLFVYVRVGVVQQHRHTAIIAFWNLVKKKTWLNDNIPNSGIQLSGLTCYHADRVSVVRGKTRGGGVCIYISNAWCWNAAVVHKHCLLLVEFLIVRCWPFYPPKEFTVICWLLLTFHPALTPVIGARHSAYSTKLSVSNRKHIQTDSSWLLGTSITQI